MDLYPSPVKRVFAAVLVANLARCHSFVASPPVSLHSMATMFRQEGRRNSAMSNLKIVLDPTMVDAGIAVVSAAAGAASQLPRIQQLERDLRSAKESLSKSEQELVSKIAELEDKLFHMDQEYEQATTRFKKQYDARMKEDLERVADKMKVDFQYKLEIRLEEQKSKLLQDQLGMVNGLTGGRQEELVDLRLRNSRVQKANQELEEALEMSKRELERIQEGAQKKGWWPF